MLSTRKKSSSSALIILLAACLQLVLSLQVVTAETTGKYKLFWPPVLNNYYPDIEMQSLAGAKVRLSSFAGKVILVEPIGMSCPACQAFAGADKVGGFSGVSPQPGLRSIDSLLTAQGITPGDTRIVRVQILLYGPGMQAPTVQEAKSWAKHFGFGQRPNEVLLIADSRYQNNASYTMIPGFQLIDKGFVLRSDASGHSPKNDLYSHLLPTIKKLL